MIIPLLRRGRAPPPSTSLHGSEKNDTRQFGKGKNHGNRLDAPAPTCRLTIAVGPTIKYMEVTGWLHFTGILPNNVVKGADKLLQKLPRRTNLAGRRGSCSKIILMDLLDRSTSQCTRKSLALLAVFLHSTQEARMNDTLEIDS